ncbi:MAG: glutaminase [Tardiphaga sp.]|nr:glutaminase [Tardiphaga sp.]
MTQAAADLEAVVKEIADEMAQRTDRGEVASYIPELAGIDNKHFGLVVMDAAGNVAASGDADVPFSIQSISKVFTLTLALGLVGDRLWRHVGREPSGNPFNSIVQLERERGVPRNPFINAGAIAVTDVILSGHQPREAIGEILRFMRFLADDTSIVIDEAVAASEKRTGFRNTALANYMKSFGVVENPVDFTLGVYFHHCAIAMSCRQAPLRHRDVVPAAGHGRPLSRLLRAQSLHRPVGGFGGARATYQCTDADLRPLRRLRRVRLSGRPARQERRRRRHHGDRAGESLDCGMGAGPRQGRQFASRPRRAGSADKANGLVDLRRLTPDQRRQLSS